MTEKRSWEEEAKGALFRNEEENTTALSHLGHEEEEEGRRRRVFFGRRSSFFSCFLSFEAALQRRYTPSRRKKNEKVLSSFSFVFLFPFSSFSRPLRLPQERNHSRRSHSSCKNSRTSRLESARDPEKEPYLLLVRMTSAPSSGKRPASGGASAPPPFAHDDELTEYERERLAKIAENKRILMELGEIELLFSMFFPVFFFDLDASTLASQTQPQPLPPPPLPTSSHPSEIRHPHARSCPGPGADKDAHLGPFAPRRRSSSGIEKEVRRPRPGRAAPLLLEDQGREGGRQDDRRREAREAHHDRGRLQRGQGQRMEASGREGGRRHRSGEAPSGARRFRFSERG